MIAETYNHSVLHLDQWPDGDRAQWQAGLLPGDILDGRAYADGLRPTTIRNSAQGYGRWLAVLRDADPSALTLPLADRVTPARVRVFLATLQAAANTNNTIKARFWELRSSLRIMSPDRDFRWLNNPAGQSLNRLLPTTLQPIDIMPISELARWGYELMIDALGLPASSHRSMQYRNGLLIAILAHRAPRLSSLASLRLGRSIVLAQSACRVAFSAEETKGKRRLEYDLPRSLTPHVAHYVNIERPSVMQSKPHDWFWVQANGNQLRIRGIEGILRHGSMTRFGKVVSAHRFRHALATASMIANPTTPGRIAAVLGNSPAVVEDHYALGGQLEAAIRTQKTLEVDRAQTASMMNYK